MILTPERLESIAALADAATPGPWESKEFAHGPSPGYERKIYRVEIVMPVILHAKRFASRLICQVIDYCTWTDHPANVAFICAARTAVPELVAHAQAMDEKLATAQARIAELERVVNRIKEEVARWGAAYPEDAPIFAPLPDPKTESHELQLYRTQASAGMGRHMSKKILGQIAGIETEGKEL